MSNAPKPQIAYDGSLFKVELCSFFDEQGRIHTREIVRHPGAVMVIPILDDSRIVMIRNHRIAVDQQLWELPAGKLEPGEDPFLAAGRELEEETGYQAGELAKLGEFYTSPGFADELMRVYVARTLQPCPQRLEPGERIVVELMAPGDLLQMIDDGTIRDGKTIAGLLMHFNREKDSGP